MSDFNDKILNSMKNSQRMLNESRRNFKSDLNKNKIEKEKINDESVEKRIIKDRPKQPNIKRNYRVKNNKPRLPSMKDGDPPRKPVKISLFPTSKYFFDDLMPPENFKLAEEYE